MRKDTFRENNPHWKGGEYVNDAGYRMVYNPEHHRSGSNGYVREHIIMAEKALGKQLQDGVQVHHCGLSGDNGKIVICQDQKYHYLLHIRARALKECGNANYRKCQFCKQYDHPNNLYIRQREKEGWIVYHNDCLKKDNKRRWACRKCN